MSTWGLDDIYAAIEQDDHDDLSQYTDDEADQFEETINFLPLQHNETRLLQTRPRPQRIVVVVAISQQEQDVIHNITSKYNTINDYLSEITEQMKLLETVDKKNKIKINNIRIETINRINNRFNELIKENDSQIMKKQNQFNIVQNELKQHQNELHNLKLKFNSFIADQEMNTTQRKYKILRINDPLLSNDIPQKIMIPKVNISFNKDVLFQYIDNIGTICNYPSLNPPILCIQNVSASSVTVQFDNLIDSVEVILEIADCFDIGNDEEEEVKLEWKQIEYSMNDEKEYDITKLEENTCYSLRAKYFNGDSMSDYSEIKGFKTYSLYGDCMCIGDENACAVASGVSLEHKIKGGALTINIGKCYTIRIYVHYWLWQIPMLILNIILLYIWSSSTDDIITELGFIAVAPVFLAALIRDKCFLWFIYWIIEHLCCCGQYGRYQFSRLADCIGGLHSSLGVTALGWNIIYFIDILSIETYKANIKTITAGSLPLLLFVVCLSAAPCFRYYYHNSFELIHRCLNWLSLCFLLIHIYFMNKDEMLLYATTNSPILFAILLTILTLYPWFIIHKLKSENIQIIPSKTGTSTAFIFPIWSPMGAVCKLSLNWAEFHVFGITPLPFDENVGHRSLVLIKSLGDWTNHLTLKAKNGELMNTLFWIHRIKPPNFSRGLFNFKKVFALATGAGIAPLIPYVINTTYFDVQISLLWVARDHINNYPQFIVNIVKPLPNVILYDTTKQPRCDLSLLTVQKANEFNAEAVFIVSNPKTAYNVANYVNKKGIPIFASNFDV